MKKSVLIASTLLAAVSITACGSAVTKAASESIEAASAATKAESTAAESTAAESVAAASEAEAADLANAGTITITDAYGEVEVPVEPETVVSLDNRTFETLSDWGIVLAAAPKAVMPADSPYVADEAVLDIGNHREPNLEIIAAADPDLVIIGQRFSGYYEDIKALVPEAAVISLDVNVSETAENPGENLVNGLKNNTTILGQIFGKEEEAEALNAEFDAAIEAAGANYDSSKTVMAVNVSGGEIGYIAPSIGRVFGPFYEVFGWTPALSVENASTNHQGDEVSVEAIAQSNPDILMVLDRDAAVSDGASPAAEVIEQSEAMQQVTAITEGKVIYAPADTYVNESIQTYIELLNSIAEAFA